MNVSLVAFSMTAIQIIARVLSAIFSVFETLLLVRAILSWIPPARNSRAYWFFCSVTEPVIRPVRKLLLRIRWVRECPIDLSFLLIVIFISGVQKLLYYFF